MQDDLKKTLTELGLTEEQVGKLETDGARDESDLAAYTTDQLTGLLDGKAAIINRFRAKFAPAPAVVPVAESVDPAAELPEGVKPSAAVMNSFASSIGMDPGVLTMFLLSGGMSDGGEGASLSDILPVPTVVNGYNPKFRDMNYRVMGQIEKRLGGPIVVINSDGSVNKALTLEYIEGLEEGRDYAENNIYDDVDGNPHEVIGVGVDAQSIYDADPLDSTKALQKNGMGTGRVNWTGVSLEVRQVAFYASRTGEISATNDAHLTWLRDHVTKAANRLLFRGQAPKALAQFNEAARTGSLPTLRVVLSRAPRRRETMPRRRAHIGAGVLE